MGELIQEVTADKKGLMSPLFYNIGKRNQINLSGDNAKKLVQIIKTAKSTYRRICLKVEGFIESNPFIVMIYSQSSSTDIFSTAKYYIIEPPTKIEFYTKVIDNFFNIFIRSKGSTGNPCYIQVTHYGTEASTEIGNVYDLDDSFTLL